jgi:hypothetical protein
MPLDRERRDLYAWRERVSEYELLPGLTLTRVLGDFLVCLREHPDPLPADPVQFFRDFLGAYLKRLLSERLAAACRDRDRLRQEVVAARVAAVEAETARRELRLRRGAEQRAQLLQRLAVQRAPWHS